MGTDGQIGRRNNLNRSSAQTQKHRQRSVKFPNMWVTDSKSNILAEVKVKVDFNTP